MSQANTHSAPIVTRVKHVLKRRQLTVSNVERLTPHMIRITAGGDDLSDFVSASPDDHCKLFVTDANGEQVMRDYTPRRFSREDRTLIVDFAVHEAGPATQWALDAKVGDAMHIGGPRGSKVISGDIRKWLLIGDETALPAMGRRIEESGAGTLITTLAAVPGMLDEQTFSSQSTVTAYWIHRPVSEAADAAYFLDALKDMQVSADTFVWIAAEGRVARTLRQHFLEDRNHPPQWLKAAGYWVCGKADAKENFD